MIEALAFISWLACVLFLAYIIRVSGATFDTPAQTPLNREQNLPNNRPGGGQKLS